MSDDVLLPLVWDGSKLSIPRARSDQDGYLSHDTFLLLSGEVIVPVTSFNTRTGEVVLLEDDVLAALGYVPQASLGYTPLNKAGDTMTGPLTLQGAPSADLHAATRAYVDHAASRLPNTYYLSDFNASGSMATFNGSISAGSNTLLLTTSTHDFAVGQGIGIVAAGNLTATAGSNLLVSKITAIAGATITIADSALHSVGGSTVKHDDTVAFQTAIDTIMAAGGGTLYCEDGFYRINGPLTDINSIIKIPFVDTYPGTTTLKAISIIGLNQPFPSVSGVPSSSNCVVFQTDRIGSNSNCSMIAAALWNPTIDIPPTSNVTVYLEGITFRTYQNPQISAVDMGMAGNALLRNVVIDPAVALFSLVASPPAGYFGLRTPRVNTGMAMDTFDNVYILGYGIGCIFAEQFRSTWISIMRCAIGMQAGFNYHPAFHVVGVIWHCPIGIKFTDRCSVDMVMDIEAPAPGNWDATIHDIEDPGNMATGWIKYAKNLGGDVAGSILPLQVQGASNLTLVSLNAATDTYQTPATFKDLTATGTTKISDGTALQPLSVGTASSADPTHRMVRVPN